MRLETIAPHCIVELPPENAFVFVPLEDEDETFRLMRDEYLASQIRYAGCMLTLKLCSIGFNIPIHVLRGRERGGGLSTARSKLIAFSRIVSLNRPCVNSLKGVARAFHRTHPNVIYSVKRYGPQIVAALEKSR